jgi:hypothetical protein
MKFKALASFMGAAVLLCLFYATKGTRFSQSDQLKIVDTIAAQSTAIESRSTVEIPEPDQRIGPGNTPVIQLENKPEMLGKIQHETGSLSFLNSTYPILNKALRTSEDIEFLKEEFSKPENHKAIVDHYKKLPQTFLFVEEASRVKMVGFLVAALELEGDWKEQVLDTVQKISSKDVRTVGDTGVAQSFAGDVIRLLAATEKYDQAEYIRLKKNLLSSKCNEKILTYYESSKRARKELTVRVQ